MKTKEQILKQEDAEFWEIEMHDMALFDQNYPEQVCMSAMDEYAKSVGVEFCKWLKKTVFDGDPDALYGYFMDKVYNKNNPTTLPHP